jgi:hypothetical protein
MTPDDRLLNLLGDWLEAQPSRAPDPLLDSIMSDLQRTPQRGRWRVAVRRLAMFGSSTARFSVAAGAVVLTTLIAVGIWSGLPGPGPGGSPLASPTASPMPTPAAVVTLSPSPPPTEAPAPPTSQPTPTSAPITWRIHEQGTFFVQASVDVAPGWLIYRGTPTMAGVIAASEDAVFWITATVRPFTDPCAQPPAVWTSDGASTADDLVAALAAIPVDVSAVTETNIGGYPARHLSFTAPPAREGCEDGHFPLWAWINGQRHGVGPGHLTQAWVVDVESTPVLIITEHRGTDQERAQLEQMLASIQLGPAD